MLKAELAQRGVEQLREAIQRENVEREVEWDAKLAMVDAKAWYEVSGLDDCSASAYHHKVGLNTREIVKGGSKESVFLPGNEMNVPEGKPKGCTEKPFLPNNKFSVIYDKFEDPLVGQRVQIPHVDKRPTKASEYTELMHSDCRQWSASPQLPVNTNSCKFESHMPNRGMCSVEPETYNLRKFLAEPVASQHVVPRLVTVPKDEAHYRCTNAAVTPDYPTPRPVIANFDGDPLSYRSFMRSFDLHIAQRMPNESAKMVYLLQHCTPKIRQDLKHFSQDLEMGYKLARETLYREYMVSLTLSHIAVSKDF